MIDEITTTRMRNAIRKMADAVLEISRIANEVKETHGYTQYIQWIKDEIGLSDWYGKIFLNVWKKFGEVGAVPPVPITILTYLVRPSTTTEAIEEITDIFESGKTVSVGAAKNIITQHKDGIRSMALEVEKRAPQAIQDRVIAGSLSVKTALDLTNALENSAPEVKDLVLNHKVSDPEIIPVLERFAEKEPEEFKTLETTGCLQAGSTPIPLAKANLNDVKDVYNEIRLNRRIEENAAQREILMNTHAHCVKIEGNAVTFIVQNADKMKVFVDGFLRFSVPVEEKKVASA